MKTNRILKTRYILIIRKLIMALYTFISIYSSLQLLRYNKIT